MVNQDSVVVKQEVEEQNGNLFHSNENGVNHQESNGNGTANGNGVRQLSQSNGPNGHSAVQVKEEDKDAGTYCHANLNLSFDKTFKSVHINCHGYHHFFSKQLNQTSQSKTLA